MLYIIHKNQKDSKGTILATACQRFDFQTIPGKPSSAFVSSALPTRPRRRASSCFHQRYRTTHHDAKVAAHTTLLITFVHNKYLTFNTCNTLQHCIILVCPFCPFCPLSLSFFLSFSRSFNLKVLPQWIQWVRPMPQARAQCAHCLDSFGLLYELLQGEWDQKMWKGIWEYLRILARQLGKLTVAAVARRLLLPWPEHCAGVAWSFCWQDWTALGITCKAYFCQEHEELPIRLKKYHGSYPMSTYQVTLCSVNHERRNHGNMSWKGCSNLKPLKPYGWDLDEALTLSQTFVFDWQELCSLAELLTCRASFLSHVGSNSWWPRQY